jgi:hypothetical protein
MELTWNQLKNMESEGRNLLTPFSKVGLSVLQLIFTKLLVHQRNYVQYNYSCSYKLNH